jgi:phosphate/sulfate permease
MTVVNDQGTKKTNWLWIGLGVAALFCICAVAVAVFLFYRVGKQVADSTKVDPEAAAKAAHEIVDSYELPAGYQERMAMNIMLYSFVMIGPDDTANTSGPIIMLAQFQTGVDQEQMEQQLRQSMEQQSGNRGMDMHLVEVKKMTIRGDETDVAIYEGSDQSGNTLRQLLASFPGKNGTAMLMIMGDAQEWDQTVIDNFINSIK